MFQAEKMEIEEDQGKEMIVAGVTVVMVVVTGGNGEIWLRGRWNAIMWVSKSPVKESVIYSKHTESHWKLDYGSDMIRSYLKSLADIRERLDWKGAREV